MLKYVSSEALVSDGERRDLEKRGELAASLLYRKKKETEYGLTKMGYVIIIRKITFQPYMMLDT